MKKILTILEIGIMCFMIYLFYRFLYIRDLSIQDFMKPLMYALACKTLLKIPILFRKEKQNE